MSCRQLVWNFDLEGIAQMYRSYETFSLWNFLKKPAKGIYISFVRAEHSTFRWAGQVCFVASKQMAPHRSARE